MINRLFRYLWMRTVLLFSLQRARNIMRVPKHLNLSRIAAAYMRCVMIVIRQNILRPKEAVRPDLRLKGVQLKKPDVPAVTIKKT